MNNQSVFQLITQVTQKENVSCVLIGGFAINYYKVTRQTVDVDFLITKEDFEKIFSSLEKAGYKEEFPSQDNFVQLKSSKLSLMDVDFMFVDARTLDKILKEARTIEIAGQKFKVPSINHLIALKLHSIKYNPKRLITDFPDIINLIMINKVDVKDAQFKELCLKFGTEEIYQRMLEVLK
jgi:predicted nucleotidyltransferase